MHETETHDHHDPQHDDPQPVQFGEAFWDERYSSAAALWSGSPNRYLVSEASDLQPGTALDVGCGEGADALWLAGRGWRVTGVDDQPYLRESGLRETAADLPGLPGAARQGMPPVRHHRNGLRGSRRPLEGPLTRSQDRIPGPDPRPGSARMSGTGL